MPRGESEQTSRPPADRPLTEFRFATVMMRLVGLYFATFGFVGVVSFFVQLALRVNRMGGFEKAMDHFSFEFVVRPILELLVGTYLLIGGHWVFHKILAPVRRPPSDDDFDKPGSNR
jgi:hypothetical protein